MGCENSKTVRVLPVGPVLDSADSTHTIGQKEGVTQTPETKRSALGNRRSASLASKDEDEGGEYTLDKQGRKVRRRRKRCRSPNTKDLMGSCHSLDDTRSLNSDRGFSATSKASADSGLGEEYAHVITEFSDENRIQEVEKAFKPREDLELSVTGVQCSTRNSAKDRTRLEEAHIMQSLREEGLISKPQVQAAGGMCFEIVAAATEASAGPKPPPRLEKLALERRKKKKRVLTEDEIRDKLERAERRRKKREHERLEKLRDMERTDALTALENFAQHQKNKEESISQRMDQVQDNKERRLQEMKEKLERRKRHAEEVRKRKALAREQGASQECSPPDEAALSYADSDSNQIPAKATQHAAQTVVGKDRVRSGGSRPSSRGSSRSRD